MKFQTYLKRKKLSANAFSVQTGIPAATVWRASVGRPVRPDNAREISAGTGGAVTLMELLFPKEHDRALTEA